MPNQKSKKARGVKVTEPVKEICQATLSASDPRQVTQSASDPRQVTQSSSDARQVTQSASDAKQATKSPKSAKKRKSAKNAKQINQSDEAKLAYKPTISAKEMSLFAGNETQVEQPALDGEATLPINDSKQTPNSGKNKNEVIQHIINEEMISPTCANKAFFFAVLCERGTIALKAVFNTFYCHKDAETEEGKLTLQQWKSKLDISNKKMKNIFGKSDPFKDGSSKDKPLKEISPVEKNFDLTTYYNLITKINENFYKEVFCPKCEHNIEEIYRYKNLLCHFGPLSEKECNVKDFIYSLEELLNCASNDLKSKKYTEPALKELLKPVNEKKNLQILRKGYENFLHDAMSDDPQLFFMRHGQNELRKKEIVQKFTIPFYWIYSVSDETSFLKRSNDLFKPAPMNIFSNPYIMYNQRKLNCADLLKPEVETGKKQPEVIFVVGHGGCGKTTLCSHIFLEWQKKSTGGDVMYNDLQLMDLVFLIEMRATNAKSVDNFLREYMSTTIFRKSDLNSYLSDLNVLYIIDGFDEHNAENIKLVQDIARLKSPSTKIVLTTRPEHFHDAKSMFNNICSNLTAVVNLKGFDREGRNEFCCKVLSEDHFKSAYRSPNPEEFCDFLQKQEEMLDEYLNLPLTVVLILLLWLQTSELKEICTATQLYTELFEMLTSKLILARKYSSVKHCTIDNRSVSAVLDVLAKCANSAYFSEKLQFEITSPSKKEVEECCKHHDVCLNEFLSAFLQFERCSAASSRSAGNHAFFHRTEMEFLSARYIAKTVMSSVEEEIDYQRLQMYYGVLPFLVGLLGAKKSLDKFAPSIVQLLRRMQVSSENFNFYSRLVIESTTFNPHSDQCRKPFCLQLCDLMNSTKWTLSADTVLSGLRLLGHCAHLELKELYIDLQMGYDPDKEEFLSYLKDRLANLQRIFRSSEFKEKLDLYFFIQNHYENQGPAVSDAYLSRVLGWTNLVKFVGAVGMEGVKHLSQFPYIKFLDLRMFKPEVFNYFVEKVFSRCQKLKQLQLMMDFPTNMKPSSLVPFKCEKLRGFVDVRLRFNHIVRQNLQWALQIIDAVWDEKLGGYDRITFQNTDFDRKKDSFVIAEALKDKVFTKVIVSTHSYSSCGTSIIKKDYPFVFEWENV